MRLYPIAFVLPHSLPPLVRLTHNQLTTTINILVTRFLRLVIRCLLIFIQLFMVECQHCVYRRKERIRTHKPTRDLAHPHHLLSSVPYRVMKHNRVLARIISVRSRLALRFS